MVARGSAAASEPARRLLLLVALLACAASGRCAAASVCDTANCGRGNCSEVPGPIPNIPNYECHCDPGWNHAFKGVLFSPCIVPECSFDAACLNLSLTPPPPIPNGVCTFVSCGAGGVCKTGGAMFSYSCECKPGYANLLNLTSLPCAKNCFFGDGCSALGLGSAAPAPAPFGDHGASPGPSPLPPPSSTKDNGAASLGSVSSPTLPPLLLLVSVAMVQLVL